MPCSLRLGFWPRCVLSLILLTANIGAPFRTSGLGRIFPENLRQNLATCFVVGVRVRVVSPSGSALGFRAVVGLARGGGPDEKGTSASPRSFSDILLSLTHPRPSRPGDRPVARPHPFLRC
jgi:hypothetical protein